MNKEAIERTKARCKKEIKYKDKILIAPGWYIKKIEYSDDPDADPQSYLCRTAKLGEFRLKEMLNENQQLFNQFRNPKHMPQVVPISYDAPYVSPIWMEFFGQTVLKAIIGIVVLIVCGLIFLFSPPAKADIYIKIGTGYKLIETDHITRANGEKIYYNTGGKLSARIEIGKESGNWTYGLSHHSQWADGFPFNDQTEPQKTELFIDYKWTL